MVLIKKNSKPKYTKLDMLKFAVWISKNYYYKQRGKWWSSSEKAENSLVAKTDDKLFKKYLKYLKSRKK